MINWASWFLGDPCVLLRIIRILVITTKLFLEYTIMHTDWLSKVEGKEDTEYRSTVLQLKLGLIICVGHLLSVAWKINIIQPWNVKGWKQWLVYRYLLTYSASDQKWHRAVNAYKCL